MKPLSRLQPGFAQGKKISETVIPNKIPDPFFFYQISVIINLNISKIHIKNILKKELS